MTRRIAACRLEQLADGDFRVVEIEGREILLAQIDGQLYAVDAICTHEDGPLGEGYLEGDAIVCPIHFTMFSLRTGEVLEGPATQALRTYPVTVDDDIVYITLSEE